MSEENRTDQRKTREMLHYDEICKHLLSYKPILARILKECVEEYRDLSYEAIQACIEPDLKGAHMHIIGRNTAQAEGTGGTVHQHRGTEPGRSIVSAVEASTV